MDELVERVARALFQSEEGFTEGCYVDPALTDWEDDGELSATVDGSVNFSALARSIIPIIEADAFERAARLAERKFETYQLKVAGEIIAREIRELGQP